MAPNFLHLAWNAARARRHEGPDASAARQTAESIESELITLTRIAEASGLRTLAYLLDMARLEASRETGRNDK